MTAWRIIDQVLTIAGIVGTRGTKADTVEGKHHLFGFLTTEKRSATDLICSKST